MQKEQIPILLYLLYDGIENTVFASQVWQPLVKLAQNDPEQKIRLISFERTTIAKINYHHPQIEIICLTRSFFWGKLSLWIDYQKIKRYCPNTLFTITARGPFAGWISLKLQNQNCQSLKIQVRGLAAAEYQYVHISSNLLKHFFYKLRFKQLHKLERSVFEAKSSRLTLECVSTALKDYILQNFQATTRQIKIAQDDLPDPIEPNLVQMWRKAMRTKLNILPNIKVYCYSGSTAKWQCLDKLISYFKARLKIEPDAKLLILCPKADDFKQILEQAQINPANYAVYTVPHKQIYEYLAAADYGILFRKKDLINFVSRPTKALEYLAVGLPIIHNNTVDWLIQNQKKSNRMISHRD